MVGDRSAETYRERQLRRAYEESVSRVTHSANVRENFFRSLCESTYEAALDIFDTLEADLEMCGAGGIEDGSVDAALKKARTAMNEVKAELEETLSDV